MNYLEYISIGCNEIKANKLRSILSILGIIIGIANIILVVSLFEGGEAKIMKELGNIGTNLIYIFPEQSKMGNSIKYLSENDLKTIKRFPGIINLTPETSLSVEVKIKGKINNVTLVGVTSQIQEIEHLEILKGRFFSVHEEIGAKKICVLPKSFALKLFGQIDGAIYKKIHIVGMQELVLEVIGIVEDKTTLGREMDIPNIYIPFTTAQRILGDNMASSVKILINRPDNIENMVKKIEDFLQNRYQGKKNFTVMNWKQLLESTQEATRIIALIGTLIAAIALLVGGIGIMNIMLVSVRERTKEIGIRKSVGASRKHILLQFMIESCLLSLIGGCFGIILGISLSKAIGYFIKIPPLINPKTIIIGVTFSGLIGIFFGIYPANQAAKLDPIESLRYE